MHVDIAANERARLLPLIYIAGPFRGPTPLDVRRNVEAARDLGLCVAAAGGYPVVPHMMTAEFDKQLDDQFWIDGTLAILMRCDGLVLTPNWERSSGARMELAWMQEHQRPWMVYSDAGPHLREDRLREFIVAVAARIGANRGGNPAAV